MTKDLNLLGLRVTDKVTGFSGTVTSVGYDLFGCIQAVVTPDSKENKQEDSRWFDTKRLKVLNPKPAMPVPDFEVEARAPKTEVPGGVEKPRMDRMPSRM